MSKRPIERYCPLSYSVPANGFNKFCIGDDCAMWIDEVEVEHHGRKICSGGYCALRGEK